MSGTTVDSTINDEYGAPSAPLFQQQHTPLFNSTILSPQLSPQLGHRGSISDQYTVSTERMT